MTQLFPGISIGGKSAENHLREKGCIGRFDEDVFFG